MNFTPGGFRSHTVRQQDTRAQRHDKSEAFSQQEELKLNSSWPVVISNISIISGQIFFCVIQSLKQPEDVCV